MKLNNLLYILTFFTILISLFTVNCSRKPEIFIGIVGNEDREMNNYTLEATTASGVFHGVLAKNNYVLTNKKRFSTIHYNDKGEGELTLKQIKRLVEVDEVSSVILLSDNSDVLAQASKYCNQKKIPLFSLTGYLNDEDEGKYAFELNDISRYGRTEILKYAYQEDGMENFILIDYLETGNAPSSETIKEELKVISGGKATLTDSLILTKNNLFEIILDISSEEEKAGVLFCGPKEKLQQFNYKFIEEGLNITKNLYFLNMMPNSGFTRDELNELSGCTFFSFTHSQLSTAELGSFVETFKSKTGEYPTYTQVLTYDILNLFGISIAKSNSKNRDEIVNNIIESMPFEGTISSIPPDSDSKTPIHINKIDITEEDVTPVVMTLKVISESD